MEPIRSRMSTDRSHTLALLALLVSLAVSSASGQESEDTGIEADDFCSPADIRNRCFSEWPSYLGQHGVFVAHARTNRWWRHQCGLWRRLKSCVTETASKCSGWSWPRRLAARATYEAFEHLCSQEGRHNRRRYLSCVADPSLEFYVFKIEIYAKRNWSDYALNDAEVCYLEEESQIFMRELLLKYCTRPAARWNWKMHMYDIGPLLRESGCNVQRVAEI